ncbi:phage tail tape measure protein [Streptomyces asiaticus]|uniref:phage tail tape measure protein n=1 Tax=Streptomyces asiaticus TaxID=114695 RepID=UPI001BA832E4|nr:phage tail tape measure protein [Streptomyces asiaticus]
MASTGIIYRLVAHDSASRTFHQVGRAAGNTESVLGKLGRTAKLAGEAVAVGLAGGLAKGAKDAARFQSEMTRISTQAGGTAKDVQVLSEQVLKLGTTTQQGPQHLAESLYHLKSVGMDNVQAMKALKESSDLAAVGHANLEETTNALAGAWRTGIKGATSFHEAVSTVNAIIGAGNMSMDQFNAAIGTGILPSAKTFGLSMKQVGAALALMTDEGIDSASAATRLRMSFSLMGAPSKAAEKQLKKIGLTGLNLADAMRGKDGLIGALRLLKDHLDNSGMSASRQSQILSRAFGGGKSSSGILLMLNNLDVLEKKQEQINRSTGKFDDAVKMQRKTAEAQWHLLVSNLEVMGIRIGTKVLPPVTDFVHFLATDAMPAAARFGKAMAGIVPVGPIQQGFSRIKGMVGDFLKGFSGTKKAASDLVGGLVDKSPHLGSGKTLTKRPGKPLEEMPHYGVGQVAPSTGVQMPRLQPMPHGGSGMIAPLISPKAKPPKSAAEKLGEMIRKSISDGFSHINWGKLGATLGKGLGDAIGWVAKHTADFTKKIAAVLGKLDFVKIGKGFGAAAIPLAIGFITNLFAPLFSLDFWKHHWLDTIIAVLSIIPIGRIASGLGKLFEHIPILKIFEPLLRGIGKLGGWIEKGFVRYVLKPIGRFGKSILGGIVRGFTEVFPGVAGKLDDFIGRMALAIVGYAGRFGAAAERLINGLGHGILKFGGSIGAWIGRVIGWLVKPFAKAGSWLVGRGRAVISGLKDGVLSVARTIGRWARDNVVRPVTGAFARAGSWLVGRGKALVIGLKDGVVSIAKSIGSWTRDHMVRPVTGVFSRAGSWLVSKGRAVVSGLKDGVIGIAKTIGTWTRDHVVRPVTGVFKSAGSWLKSAGGHLLSGLKDGIVGAIKGIGHWIKSHLVDPVVKAVKHFFGIHSPSRVFMGIGGHLVSGLIRGMSKTSGTAIAKRVFGSLPKALSAIVKKGLVSVAKLPGKALKALGGLGGDILDLLGLGGGGGGSSVNQRIGETLAAARGWSGPQWNALKALWNGESGWNERALNKSSGAYGIPQSLPASKMASAGSDWKTNAATQIKWGLKYIASVYGNPVNAYSKWLARSPHWYAKGTSGAAPGLAWVGEKGPELVNFKGGEDVLSHQQSMLFAKTHGIKLPGYASGTINNAADRVRRDRQRVEDAKDAVARARRRHKGVAAAEKRLRAAETELKAAQISLRNAQRSAKTSIANTIATGLQKTLSTGTSSAIASAIKSLATKLLNAGYTKTAASIQKKGGRLESLATRKASIQKTINAANQYASDQASNITDFLSVSGTTATNVRDLIGQATSQQKTASNFVALSKSLKARGASKALLQQLSDAGPGSQLATILGDRKVTTNDIKKLNSLMKSGGKLATSFGKDMADLMYDSGKDAGKGFLAGLKAQEKALGKQMAKLAADLVKQIKKILKIKSPSGVFRDEVGKNVVLGMAHGIDLHSHLVGAAAQRMADTATGVSMRRRYVPTAASGRSSTAEEDARWERLAQAIEASGSELHVNFRDDRLRDLIDVQVKPKIKASEDRQAYRAKVGRR